MAGSYSKVPGGNIEPSTFVKLSTTADGQVLQCGAGEKVFGISQPCSRRIALDPYDTGSTVYAGIAGDPAINIYGPGDPGVLLRLAGTVSAGGYIKSDGSGYGVAATTDKDAYGARALCAGASGQLIPVEVVVGYVSV